MFYQSRNVPFELDVAVFSQECVDLLFLIGDVFDFILNATD